MTSLQTRIVLRCIIWKKTISLNTKNATKPCHIDFVAFLMFFQLAGEEGIEPPLTVLETAALPLYYSPKIRYWLI